MATACIGMNGGKNTALAHRVAYELEVGPIPDGMQLDHLCRVRNCVNPSHLEVVDNATNTARGTAGDWQRNKTHCAQGHEYNEENTRVSKDYMGRTRRTCRACERAKDQRKKATNVR